MSGGRFQIPRPRPLLGAALTLALLTGTLLTAPATVAAEPCTNKPEIIRSDDLLPGMLGTGYTVVRGREPASFDVEILGVQDDGIAPDVDFVLVKVSGPVIDMTGGIAAGFSGSPVYIDGKLAGAIAYGFFAADQTIGGMTPAEAMLQILDYPGGPTSAARAASVSELTEASSVRLSSTLRRRAARAAGESVSAFPSDAEQLRVPLGVSGLNARSMKKLRKFIRRADLPFLPYRSAAASGSGTGGGGPLERGDAVAAALSMGDLTMAGVGTATAVCGDLLVGFGHPFFWEGATQMGMNAADVVTVIKDPSNLIGGFKVANVAELRGTIDQDRLAGVRGLRGVLPQTVPVTSDVRNPDLSRSRHGTTTALKLEELSYPLLPFIAAFHLLVNEDVTFDRIGDGTVGLTFALEGIGPTGEPFRLERSNMHFSNYDISYRSIVELAQYIAVIHENRFGDVRWTSIDADSTITQQHLTAKIDRVSSASSVNPRLKKRDVLRVVPGDTIRLRVFLLPEGSETPEKVNLEVPVSPTAREGGILQVRGGGDEGCFFCIFFDEKGSGGGKPKSFEALLAKLAGAERNNDLVARLRVSRSKAKVVSTQARVIQGRKLIEIRVLGEEAPPKPD